jgi:monofunctional glycosyltransferase
MFRILGRIVLLVPLGALLLSVLMVAALRWIPPPYTSFMAQSPVRPVKYRWVPADQIADEMRKAVVASEDQKFWKHRGFDLEAIEKAREHNVKHKKIRGGSTISQQTAKNLFLWPGGGYVRKGIEAYFTVLMEAFWPKQRILEVYLNVAEFGPGVYGVEEAARNYLHKSAADLTASDAARLAAVLPSPRRWRAWSPGPYVQSRAAWILRQMGYGSEPNEEDEPLEPADGATDPVETTPEEVTPVEPVAPPEPAAPAESMPAEELPPAETAPP